MVDHRGRTTTRWWIPVALLVVGLAISVVVRPTNLVLFLGVALLTASAVGFVRRVRAEEHRSSR